LENLNGRGHSKNVGLDEEIIRKYILGEYGGRLWTGSISFRTGTSDRLF